MKLPVGIGISYNAELQRLVNKIKKDINQIVVPVLVTEQPNYVTDAIWIDRILAAINTVKAIYDSHAYKLWRDKTANKFVDGVEEASSKSLASFGVDIFGGNSELQSLMELSAYDNSRLIKTISDKYLSNVESMVITNVRAGNRSSQMIKQLSEEHAISKKHAKFIARDQTAKVNSSVAQQKIESAGFEYFQWMTAKDSRVRDRHSSISKRKTEFGVGVYQFKSPPLSDKGVPILPGTDYQCRCTMKPVSQKKVDNFKL